MKRSKRRTKKQRKEEAAALLMEVNLLASIRRMELADQLRASKAAHMEAKIRNFGANYGISAARLKIMGFSESAMHQLPYDLKLAGSP